jgi:hypothetical protein
MVEQNKKTLILLQGQVQTCGTTLFGMHLYLHTHSAECHHTLSPITPAQASPLLE